MKRLFVLVALGTVIAAPAFAQRDPNGRHHVRASHQEQSSTVPRHARDTYYERNNNLNPDFQLGGSWWKRHQRKHAPASRSVSQK
jgi:hypothetical protein